MLVSGGPSRIYRVRPLASPTPSGALAGGDSGARTGEDVTSRHRYGLDLACPPGPPGSSRIPAQGRTVRTLSTERPFPGRADSSHDLMETRTERRHCVPRFGAQPNRVGGLRQDGAVCAVTGGLRQAIVRHCVYRPGPVVPGAVERSSVTHSGQEFTSTGLGHWRVAQDARGHTCRAGRWTCR
jgi:hypothetical protein